MIELDHPRITRIADTGQYGKQFYYVLEDPGGDTVEALIEANGGLEVSRALRLHLQLSEALLAARTKPGLLSRVWPRNLMITGEGMDSRIYVVAQNLVTLTDQLECPEFLAPEVLAGEEETTQASLYSIGSVLYYMLAGKSPYRGDLSEAALLEAKRELPDMDCLPEGAPVTC